MTKLYEIGKEIIPCALSVVACLSLLVAQRCEVYISSFTININILAIFDVVLMLIIMMLFYDTGALSTRITENTMNWYVDTRGRHIFNKLVFAAFILNAVLLIIYIVYLSNISNIVSYTCGVVMLILHMPMLSLMIFLVNKHIVTRMTLKRLLSRPVEVDV